MAMGDQPQQPAGVLYIDPANLKAALESEEGALRYLTRKPSPGDVALYTTPQQTAGWRPIMKQALEVLETIVQTADGRNWSGNMILDENSPIMGAARDVLQAAASLGTLPDSEQDPDRAAFEAWARRDMPRLSLRYNERLEGYMAPETQLAFISFCSARGPTAHPSQQQDDELDAKRYRWLRDKWGYIEDEYDGYDQDKMLRIYKADEDHGWDVDPESLDAAIDAAMSDSAGEGGKNG
jgi:hypothetical protein